MNVSEQIGYRGIVTSTNRESSQQRRETVTDFARLHDVRVDVDGIEPASHVHHVFGYFTEGVRSITTVCRWHNHGG